MQAAVERNLAWERPADTVTQQCPHILATGSKTLTFLWGFGYPHVVGQA